MTATTKSPTTIAITTLIAINIQSLFGVKLSVLNKMQKKYTTVWSMEKYKKLATNSSINTILKNNTTTTVSFTYKYFNNLYTLQ